MTYSLSVSLLLTATCSKVKRLQTQRPSCYSNPCPLHTINKIMQISNFTTNLLLKLLWDSETYLHSQCKIMCSIQNLNDSFASVVTCDVGTKNLITRSTVNSNQLFMYMRIFMDKFNLFALLMWPSMQFVQLFLSFAFVSAWFGQCSDVCYRSFGHKHGQVVSGGDFSSYLSIVPLLTFSLVTLTL